MEAAEPLPLIAVQRDDPERLELGELFAEGADPIDATLCVLPSDDPRDRSHRPTPKAGSMVM